MISSVYPLVNVYITMENNRFKWVNQLQMAIFTSFLYVYQRVFHSETQKHGEYGDCRVEWEHHQRNEENDATKTKNEQFLVDFRSRLDL